MSATRRKCYLLIGRKLLAVSIVLLLAACGTTGLEISGASTPSPALWEETGSFTVEGRLVPRQHTNLVAAASRQVTEILIQEGEAVQAGAVILRLGSREEYLAEIASAEMAVLSAQQALEVLDKNVRLDLARARQALAEANKEHSKIEGEFRSLNEQVPQAVLEQAYASVVAAKHRLERANQDLEKAKKHYRNKHHILWKILTRNQFKGLLTSLRTGRNLAQKRYEETLARYNHLLAHPDEIKLAQAQANLQAIQARIAELQDDIADLENGPDPGKVSAANARLNAARLSLIAVRAALKDSEIVAPLSGTIVKLSVRVGEWVEADRPVVVLADLSQWIVETNDLTEIEVPGVSVGQNVIIAPNAFPGLELKGMVEHISDAFEERRGDITYTTRVKLDQPDERLRWGMTVAVTFEK